jgi:hypothetical protein
VAFFSNALTTAPRFGGRKRQALGQSRTSLFAVKLEDATLHVVAC